MAKTRQKHFGHLIIEDVLKMKFEGMTHKQLSDYYGFKDKHYEQI